MTLEAVVGKIKALFVQMVSYFSIYEIAILLSIFFIFIMLFTLGLLLRGRKFVAGFFITLSIAVIFATPFILQFAMQEILYKIDVKITNAYPMQFTKGFFVASEVSNNGKIPINECLVSVNEVREESNSIIKIINRIFPKSSSHTSVDIDIDINETKHFSVIVPQIQAKEPFLYQIFVDCYLSNKFAQKVQKNKQHQNEHIITPTPPDYDIKFESPQDDTQQSPETESL